MKENHKNPVHFEQKGNALSLAAIFWFKCAYERSTELKSSDCTVPYAIIYSFSWGSAAKG